MSPSFPLQALLRSDIASMEEYTPILPLEILSEQLGREPANIVKLDANENPYGPSPRVAGALAAMPHPHIYPDPEARHLRNALARYTNVDSSYLMAGHGADELIDLLMRLFIQPGDVLINCPPTFGMYSFDARVNGAQVINISRCPDFRLDIDALAEAVAQTPRAKLLFIASPNNPDGGLVPDAALQRLLALPLVVVLDEAYAEFAGQSRIDWVPRYPNLVVLRTFSKWAGLAGLRVGYGAFPAEIIRHLWKIKQPYNVNVAGQVAALASLADRAHLLQNVAHLVAERRRLFRELQTLGWLTPYPSRANFILCRVEHPKLDAQAIRRRLARDFGVLVRYYHTPELQAHLRFSIGTPAQMTILMEALRAL
ncbi:MAG: histidinol-phosphate transaminase [Anaerolineae bacterium]